MQQIEITWEPINLFVTATLDFSRNPKLAELLWVNLPYASLQNHALVSGHHLYHLTPFPELIDTSAQYKEDRTQSPDGAIFLSQLQHMAIKYGPLSEYIPAAPVGCVIDEDLPRLREAGHACWDAVYRTKQPIITRVTRKGEIYGDCMLSWAPLAGDPAMQELIGQMRATTERIWLTPPQEIIDLRSGHKRSRQLRPISVDDGVCERRNTPVGIQRTQ